MASPAASMQEDPLVEVVNNADGFKEVYRSISAAFGRQTRDAIWVAANPNWDTAEGQAAGAERMVQRWKATTTDNKGNPNTIFLKATLPDPDQPGRRVVAGVAIWLQASAVEGYGDVPSEKPGEKLDLESLHPGNETEQRFVAQAVNALRKDRIAFIKGRAAAADPPSVMVLDSCTTDPAFQRRGVASKLVQWGLDEARRRGVPYALTEASSMGRHVYQRLGFEPQGTDMEYEMDEEFANRPLPPNLFMVWRAS
ncbi:acyl-CoA N-acyltransferase [Xylariaceae sp. FL0594]|nr:acyl-CoA N-acyltransferase [Xylariaceae sp. FL0594]